jgi:hypothetical protein
VIRHCCQRRRKAGYVNTRTFLYHFNNRLRSDRVLVRGIWKPYETTAQPRPREARIAAIAGMSSHHFRPASYNLHAQQAEPISFREKLRPVSRANPARNTHRPSATIEIASGKGVCYRYPETDQHVACHICVED